MNALTRSRVRSFFSRALLSTCVFLLSPSLLAIENLEESGVYFEGDTPQFLVAVMTERGFRTTEDLLKSQQDKSLHLKILVDKIYARRFHRFWQEGTAINVDPQSMKNHAKNMVAYRELTDFALHKNDVFVVKRDAPIGTVIELNGRHIGAIEDPDFFNILLSAIVGPVPVSAEIKNKVLQANIMAKKLTRTRIYDLDAERTAATAKWLEDQMRVHTKAQQVAAAPKNVASTAATRIPTPTLEADETEDDKRISASQTSKNMSLEEIISAEYNQASRARAKKVGVEMVKDSLADMDNLARQKDVKVESLIHYNALSKKEFERMATTDLGDITADDTNSEELITAY